MLVLDTELLYFSNAQTTITHKNTLWIFDVCKLGGLHTKVIDKATQKVLKD